MLREGLERCTRSLNVGLAGLFVWCLLALFFPFLIVDLTAPGALPPAVFTLGVVGGLLSLFYLVIFYATVSSVALWAQAEQILARSSGSRRTADPSPDSGRAVLLGIGAVSLGVVSFASLGYAGANVHHPALYALLFDVASGIIFTTLVVVAVFLTLASRACARLLHSAPAPAAESRFRDGRLVARTAGFAVVPGVVLLVGAATNWITVETFWPAFLGVLTPLGASMEFLAARSAIVTWRNRLQAGATSLAASPAMAPYPAPVSAPLLVQAPLEGGIGGTEYDLRDLNVESRRLLKSARRKGVGAGALAFALVAALVLVAGVPRGASVGSALVVLVPVSFLGVLALALSVRRPAPGLLSIRIDSERVIFHLDDRSMLAWDWHRPPAALVLRDYAPTRLSPAGIPGARYWLQAEGAIPFFGAVSEAAAHQLVDLARAGGLVMVSSEGWSTARGGTRSLNLRISSAGT